MTLSHHFYCLSLFIKNMPFECLVFQSSREMSLRSSAAGLFNKTTQVKSDLSFAESPQKHSSSRLEITCFSLLLFFFLLSIMFPFSVLATNKK